MKTIICCISCCVVGTAWGISIAQYESRYPVSHTRLDWVNTIHAFDEIQTNIRMSDMPASKAFWCDSVLQAQKNDINQQVYSAMQAEAADTVKPKKK